MKTKIILSLTLCLGMYGLMAQQGAVRNTSVRVSDDQDKVTITYDLVPTGKVTKTYNIKVEISLDGKVMNNLRGLSGDFGNQITQGLGKKIVWDVLTDIAELSGELKVKVYEDITANLSGLACPISTGPAYTGLLSFAGLGGTVIFFGASKYNDAYDWYQNEYIVNPKSVSKEDFEKNKKNFESNSKIYMGLGAGVVAVGVVAFISKISKVNKYNRDCMGTGSILKKPKFQIKPLLPNDDFPSVGIGISLN